MPASLPPAATTQEPAPAAVLGPPIPVAQAVAPAPSLAPAPSGLPLSLSAF